MADALHDYLCARCGCIERDVPVPIALGAMKMPVLCPLCEDVEMDWLPQIGRMSAAHGPTFTAFDTYDGQNRPVRVESIADLRRIEAESERQARNGEGQVMVWRDFSNDASNRDLSAIAKDWVAPGITPRQSDWHDHPPLVKVPTRSAEEIAKATAEPGAENATLSHLR